MGAWPMSRATSRRQSARPAAMRRAGGQRDQQVPGTVEVQDREVEGVEPAHRGARAGHDPDSDRAEAR